MANYETAVCATLVAYFLEKYSSGRRGAPAKGVGRVTGAEVQIFSSPPNKMGHFLVSFFILFGGEDLNFVRVGYSARKERARAHPVGEAVRAKEWQSSKRTSKQRLAMFDWLTTTVQRNTCVPR